MASLLHVSCMAIEIKNERSIAALRAAAQLAAQALEAIGAAVKPGARLSDLDRLAEAFLHAHGAEPLFKGYRGPRNAHPPFPGTICTSVNHEICHGLPDQRRLRAGDIVSVDIGLRLNGYCGDTCATFAVGAVSPLAQRLIAATEDCLACGSAAAQVGNFVNDIGGAIEDRATRHGFGVVREFTGHGIGRTLHEDPSVWHYRSNVRGARLQPGMVINIEPMIAAGNPAMQILHDGWTAVTRDRSLVAQFEQTVWITSDGPVVLSRR